MYPKTNIYEQITSVILEAIEKGCEQFQMPWNSTLSVPRNAESGRLYRGINVLVLWAMTQRFHYATDLWATYQQWSQVGAQVRKGAKSATVVFWKFTDGDPKDQDDDPSTTSSPTSHCFAKAYHVFNADQVDNFAISAPVTFSENQRIEKAERFFKQTGAVIEERGSSACYDVGADRIYMPPFAQFLKSDFFYSTLAHEVSHWTGAASRLNRQLANRFGSEAYAVEELVAELGSAFLSAELGLASEPRSDHAPYINNWLRLLKSDKRAIFTAAGHAQHAVDWLLEHGSRGVEG